MFHRSKSVFHSYTLIALLASLLGSALNVTPAYVSGIVVNTDTDKDGLLMFDGLCGLREAIINANNDTATYPDCTAGSGADTITFAANYTITLRAELQVTTAVTIDGTGQTNTIVQANANPGVATYRVFAVSLSGNLTVDSLTVRNGRCGGACAAGGGISSDGSLTINNSAISANSATDAGGISSDGSLSINNSTISANSATDAGGGIYDTGSTTLTNVTLVGNSATFGGGMYNQAASANLMNVTFSGNSALENSSLSPFSYAGGMYNEGSYPTLTNVTFSGNFADLGGGMYNHLSGPTLTNVTFSGNSAFDGGGIANQDSIPTLINSVVANSSMGGDCIGSLDAASSNNLIEDSSNACGLTNGVNSNIIGQGPNLGLLANNGGLTQTMALLPSSPAIDAGDDMTCAPTDQRGMVRPQGSHCDIGAYELPISLMTFSSAGAQDGWILESSETSKVGGSMNASATTLNVGDESGDRQYRAVLHFNTASLPDTAVISSVTLKIKKQGVVGTNPFNTHGNLLVDLRKPSFGTASLALADFQAAASQLSASSFDRAPVNNWYTALFNNTSFTFVNLVGTTQFRLHFTKDDNDDNAADYVEFFSGNYAVASARPQLLIQYYVP